MEHPDKSEQALRCSQNCANTSHIICGTPPGLKETSIEYQELTQSDTENHRVALRKTLVITRCFSVHPLCLSV
jgi:hypothetical protein